MQAIALLLLKKVGTEALLYLLKELIKILEKRTDNNIAEADVAAVESRIEKALDGAAKPLRHK